MASESVSSLRKTETFFIIVSWRSVRIVTARSPSVRERMPSSIARVVASGLAGRARFSASPVRIALAIAMPVRRPKTTRSSSELVPRRFAPWTLTQAASPTAKKPGTVSPRVLPRTTCPSVLVGMPPIA